MNIALRVDAGQKIGTGHFMRCLTLANTLKQRGARCIFLSRHLPQYLAQILEDQGHTLCSLPARNDGIFDTKLAHASWLETTQQADAADSLEVLRKQEWDWLVVDHYAIDATWETQLRPAVRRILVIDDLADRQHDCDLLLDQNFYRDMHTRYEQKVPKGCGLLLGPRFALLREEFRTLRSERQRPEGDAGRILVFFGGVDEHNFTGQVLSALACMPEKQIYVDVVLGALHPQRDVIQALCHLRGYNCHVQTTQMAELMLSADLAIGAGGTATWERCCLGLPTLALCTAQNQAHQLEDAARQGLVYSIELNQDIHGSLVLHIGALLENPSLRAFISGQGMSAVDGSGGLRIASRMGCTGVTMRAANSQDSAALHRWRNHASIRAVSRSVEPISWEEHCAWFNDVQANPRRKLLIGEREGEPVGVVRFDLEDSGQAEVSIYLVPDASFRCRGSDLLQSAENWISRHCTNVLWIHAHVKGTNKRSNGLFIAAGYDIENTRFLKKLHDL